MGSRGANKSTPTKYLKTFSNSSGQLTAEVRHFSPLGEWNGQYAVHFFALGTPDNDYRGTNGTGLKVYDTEDKAIQSAKRYVRRWK